MKDVPTGAFSESQLVHETRCLFGKVLTFFVNINFFQG
jgi:hypothetical protein